MISFRDFAPKLLDRGNRLTGATYEPFEAAITAANAWIQQAGVKVINVETVVLPNIWYGNEEGTKDSALTTLQGQAVWHQFIRVWFEA